MGNAAGEPLIGILSTALPGLRRFPRYPLPEEVGADGTHGKLGVKFADHIDLHLVPLVLVALILVFMGTGNKWMYLGAFIYLQCILIAFWFFGRKTRSSGSVSYLAVNELMVVGSLSLCWLGKLALA